MGRTKLEIKKIEDKARHTITFSKRKNGLLKKPRELSMLCDVDIAVIAFSASGTLTEFCTNDRMQEILDHFAIAKKMKKSVQVQTEAEKMTAQIEETEEDERKALDEVLNQLPPLDPSYIYQLEPEDQFDNHLWVDDYLEPSHESGGVPWAL